ncbi:MAG: hypothetical protein DWH91_16190 [Planctomycetota bacterium]|nr:MAG: hypothetical protein DWH91_16190 [Planctomycetota bacterium]
MDLIRNWGWRAAWLSVGLACASNMAWAETVDPETPEIETPVIPNPNARFKEQIGDEEPVPADPKAPTTPEHLARRKAMTWYLSGQLQLSRSEIQPERAQTAEDSFRKAVELDPTFMQAQEMLVSLLIGRNKLDEAKAVSFTAAEKTEAGFDLIRKLAGQMARNNAESGATLLVDALQIKTLPPQSVMFYQIQRDLGLLYRLSGKKKESAESYRLVFDAVTRTEPAVLTPKQIQTILVDPGALFEEMGLVFLDSKQPELALDAFNRASAARGEQTAAHSYNLALVFRETGKPDVALVELNKYLDAQLQNKGRSAYQLLKDLLSDLKQESELIGRLEELRGKDRQNSKLSYFLAEQYVATQRLTEAETLILNGQPEPRDPYAIVGLIPVYRGLSKAPQLLKVSMMAIGLFESLSENGRNASMRERDPDIKELVERFEHEQEALIGDSAAMDGLVSHGRDLMKGDEPKIQFVEAYVLGKLTGEAERVEDAHDFYRQAISMQNDPPFDLYSELGQVYLNADRYDEAVAIYQEAVNHPSTSLQRNKWRALYLLSYALEFGGKTDAALEAITESRKASTEEGLDEFTGGILHAQIGWIHSHAHQHDKAIAVYEEVLKKYPKDARTLENTRFALSNVYVMKGEMAKGESVLEEVLKASPDNAQANNDLGYLWVDQGKNLEQALAMIQKALSLEPENAAYIDSLGWTLFKLGRTEEAVKELERACQMKRGDDPTLHDHLGDCYQKLDRKADAQKTWKKSLELLDKKKSNDDKLRKSLIEKLGQPVAK